MSFRVRGPMSDGDWHTNGSVCRGATLHLHVPRVDVVKVRVTKVVRPLAFSTKSAGRTGAIVVKVAVM